MQFTNHTGSSVFSDAMRKVYPEARVREEGEKLSSSELERMSFKELRKELSHRYVPCSGASTKSSLLDLYAQDFYALREQLPLYKLRKEVLSKGAGGRVGLLICQNVECLNSEDGHTPFDVCSACKSPAYCSRECQKVAWRKHKRECASMKQENKELDEGTAQMMSMIGEVARLHPKNRGGSGAGAGNAT